MISKIIRVSLFAGIMLGLSACEKSSDRCNCVSTSDSNDSYETSVEDQECSDLSNGNYNCYPTD